MPTPTRIIIIGAGWSGLSAAKTYLECSEALNRRVDLTVLDDSADPGGVWTTQRLYPGLVANNPNGLYELSDLSLVDGEHPHFQAIPGSRIQAYLEAYARKFDIYDKIKFGVRVVKVRRRQKPSPPGWTVETAAGELLECDKLIVAVGLHSTPKAIPLSEAKYTGTSIHSCDLGRTHEGISADPTVKDVVVVGGCKSAVEACSLFLASSKRIKWLIRPSEQGAPLVVVDPDQKPNLVAVANARLFSIFSPSVFSTSGIWYRFLQSGTWILGTLFLKIFFRLMNYAIRRGAHYDKSQNAKRLEPAGGSLFFDAPYLSLIAKDHPFLTALHEDNPNRLIVYRAKPIKLKGREIVTEDANGKEARLRADAVIWCIGWKPGLDFFDPAEALELGLPVPLRTIPTSKSNAAATSSSGPATPSAIPPHEFFDAKIRALFPTMLSDPGRKGQEPPAWTRWSLYRHIIPTKHFATGDRTLAFAGLISSSQTATACELSALWAVAWLEDLFARTPMPLVDRLGAGRLNISSSPRSAKGPDQAALQNLADAETRLIQAWQARRYGIRGVTSPEIILEIKSFLDVLCLDLGVEHERKRWRMKERNAAGATAEAEVDIGGVSRWFGLKDYLREYLEPYRAPDYRGIVSEFLRNRDRDRGD